MCQCRGMRRDDICLYLSPDDRAELQSLVADRNTPRKLVWRAGIVLATADGHGTVEIMRRADTSKPTVWRWQERYHSKMMQHGTQSVVQLLLRSVSKTSTFARACWPPAAPRSL